MALSIKNPLAERLAREAAEESGESITRAIIHALEAHLRHLRGRSGPTDLAEEIMKISKRCRSLPDRDPRSPEEILGYDEENGVTG